MEMADEGLVIATVVGLSLLLALAVHRAFFRPCAERPERMSKQAKKEAKYEARKQGMRVKREDYRRRRSARLSSEFEGLDEEEQSALKLRLRRDKEDAQQRVARGFEQGLNVCVELSFENSARELRSLCKQLSLLYGANRSAQCPAHIHLTALAAPLRDMLQQQGLDAWTVSTSAESVMDLFPPEQIVVLSPDATDVVHVFESSKVCICEPNSSEAPPNRACPMHAGVCDRWDSGQERAEWRDPRLGAAEGGKSHAAACQRTRAEQAIARAQSGLGADYDHQVLGDRRLDQGRGRGRANAEEINSELYTCSCWSGEVHQAIRPSCFLLLAFIR